MNNKSSKCTKSRKKHPKKLKNIMKHHKMSAAEKSNMQQPLAKQLSFTSGSAFLDEEHTDTSQAPQLTYQVRREPCLIDIAI